MKNLVSLTLTEQQLAAVDAALTTIETELAGLISVPVAQRRDLFKMGEKSEVFCRQTLSVLSQNLKIVPESLGLPEALADVAARLAVNDQQPEFSHVLVHLQGAARIPIGVAYDVTVLAPLDAVVSA